MLKKVTLFALAFALILGAGSLRAEEGQKVPQFSSAPAAGTVIQLAPDTKLGLQNMADLTPDELKKALESPACGTKAATFCTACTGLNCTGFCYNIPCGRYANANQQVPPRPGFRSFRTGCSNTLVSTCNDLNTTPPCQGFQFPSATWGNNTCINSNSLLLQSVGCL